MRQITPFVWLAIGGVFATLCLGKGAVPFAAWLAPIFLLRFARRVARISSVPGCGWPSGVHWSHGRKSIIASAKSAPTSGSSPCVFQTPRIASA